VSFASRNVLAAFVLAASLALVLASSPASAAQNREAGVADGAGLERAHAHNDYEHERPLFDALDRGFKSVEADVWLVDGELLVAHDREDVKPGRTLESLYLDRWKRRSSRTAAPSTPVTTTTSRCS
jgi:hypothetical protein